LKTAGSQDVFAADNSISGSASVNVVADSSPAMFVVSAPSTVSAGVPFSFTVTAKDIYGNIVTGYTGTVHFTSTDNSAILPSDYTFQASDSGSKSFAGIILETAGIQTISATDTSASITGTSDDITVTANADSQFHSSWSIIRK
jgi:hypothetical protein